MDELFGREGDLAGIDRFLESVRQGGDGLLLRGEPGIGKSVLLAAAADLAEAAGFRVLPASGSEFEADVSYSLLNQLLLPLYDEVQRLPPAFRDALIVALGFGSGPVPGPLLVGNAVRSLLTTVARKAPVLLVVDDVQWVDRPSAVVLGFVARRVQGSPVGVIASSRTGTESFLDRRGLTEVTVQPLGRDACAELVAARFPAMASRTRHRLLDLAQGNPLALVELPATLTDSAGHHHADFVDVVPLSERLQAMFANRIAALPDTTRLLLLLATFESSGEVRVLRELADLAALAPAERAQLVRVDDSTGRLTFRHPLIQSAIVATSTHEERRGAHLAIAATLPDDLERRAWHLAAATIGPDEAVAALLDDASDRVMQRGDAIAAIAALTRAADLSATDENRARRLARAAYFGAQAGENADASTLLADARTISMDPAGSLQAATAAALLISGGGDAHTAHHLLAGAIQLGDHGWRADDPALDDAMHILLVLSWNAFTPEHWAVFHRTMAQLKPEPPALLALMSRTFADPVRTGAAAAPELDALLATLTDHDDPTQMMRLGSATLYLDRLGDIREHFWRLVRQARDGGAPRWHVTALTYLCVDSSVTGQWDEVEELAQEGLELSEANELQYVAWFFQHRRAFVAAGRGRSEEAFRLADEITHWAMPRGVAAGVSCAHHIRTLAAAAAGDSEAAYLHASAISPAGLLAPYVPNALWVMFDLVEAALRTGRTAEAEAHALAMRSANVAGISSRMRLIQHGVDALVLDSQAAEAQLERTLRDPASERWLFDVCRIRLAFAERLRRRKDSSGARAHLIAAHAGFTAMGAEPWLARTTIELRATGHRPVATAAAEQSRATLTPQEQEIAGLAASGLSNKQIAERLYLSPRTVGAHLYRIFPKLGVTSRAGIRDALSAQGGAADHP